MPLDDIAKALADKAARAAKELQTDWLLQVGVATLGTMYLVDTPLAAALAQNFKLEPSLIKVAVPGVSIFLFAKMGYRLGVYFRTKTLFLQRIKNESEQELLEFVTADHSLYYVLADLVIHTHPKGGRQWWTILPWSVIGLVAYGVHIFSNALTIYFVYSLFGPLISVIVALVLGSFYVQFGVAMRPEIRRWSLVIFATLLVMVALTMILVWWNPLAHAEWRPIPADLVESGAMKRLDLVRETSVNGGESMRLCHDCLDQRDGLQRQSDRRTSYGEKCEGCGRIETENPRSSA